MTHASVAGTELETVMKGKRLKFDPKDALEQGYFGAQLGDELEVGMQWVELAEKDAKNVWPNVAHELGGHFEYGKAYATEIMSAALERMLRRPAGEQLELFETALSARSGQL